MHLAKQGMDTSRFQGSLPDAVYESRFEAVLRGVTLDLTQARPAQSR